MADYNIVTNDYDTHHVKTHMERVRHISIIIADSRPFASDKSLGKNPQLTSTTSTVVERLYTARSRNCATNVIVLYSSSFANHSYGTSILLGQGHKCVRNDAPCRSTFHVLRQDRRPPIATCLSYRILFCFLRPYTFR